MAHESDYEKNGFTTERKNMKMSKLSTSDTNEEHPYGDRQVTRTMGMAKEPKGAERIPMQRVGPMQADTTSKKSKD